MLDKLREWQQEALDRFIGMGYPKRYLVHATPGAGKTILSAAVAQKLRQASLIDLVVILTPKQNIRENWKNVMHGVGFDICTEPSQLRHDEFDGVAICYQLLAAGSAESLILEGFIADKRVLFIIDEIHHAAEGGPNGGGNSWGDGVIRLVSRAGDDFMLGLTGTPWREPGKGHLPFVHYNEDSPGVFVAVPDFSYGYGRSVMDGVCRIAEFRFYRSTGAEVQGEGLEFSEMNEYLPEEQGRRIYRQSILQPDSPFLKAMILDAEAALREKESELPGAGALFVADDIDSAKNAARLIEELTGSPATVVHSEDRWSIRNLGSFADGIGRWLVAVDMVSEGVDIPRLAVVVYATTDATELKFRQIVGRAVRCIGPSDPLVATIFLGRLHPLIDHAALIEEEKHHVVVDLVQQALEAVREPRSEAASFRQDSTLRIVNAEADGVMFRGAWDTEVAERVREVLAESHSEREARELAQTIAARLYDLNLGQSAMPVIERDPIPKADQKNLTRQFIKAEVGRLLNLRGQRNDRDAFRAYNGALIKRFGDSVSNLPLETLADVLRFVQNDVANERRQRGIL